MLTVVVLVFALVILPSPWGAVAVGAAVVADLCETGLFVWWSQRRPSVIGTQTLVGRRAAVVGALVPAGQVRIDGEIWEAHSDTPVDPGSEVVICGVDGLVLEVEPAPERHPEKH